MSTDKSPDGAGQLSDFWEMVKNALDQLVLQEELKVAI
jgi:hypothetical protein